MNALRRVKRNLRWVFQGTVVSAVMAAAIVLWLPDPAFVWPLVVLLALVPILLVTWAARSVDTHWDVDADEVRHIEEGNVVQRLRWADLERVHIVTDDSGPWGEDFWWVLEGPGGAAIAVPSERVHSDDAMMSRLLQLHGFDHSRVLEAIGSTSNNRFVVWEDHDLHG